MIVASRRSAASNGGAEVDGRSCRGEPRNRTQNILSGATQTPDLNSNSAGPGTLLAAPKEPTACRCRQCPPRQLSTCWWGGLARPTIYLRTSASHAEATCRSAVGSAASTSSLFDAAVGAPPLLTAPETSVHSNLASGHPLTFEALDRGPRVVRPADYRAQPRLDHLTPDWLGKGSSAGRLDARTRANAQPSLSSVSVKRFSRPLPHQLSRAWDTAPDLREHRVAGVGFEPT
jgi:hypothetical protein